MVLRIVAGAKREQRHIGVWGGIRRYGQVVGDYMALMCAEV